MYVLIDSEGQVHGPFVSKESAKSWRKETNLKGRAHLLNEPHSERASMWTENDILGQAQSRDVDINAAEARIILRRVIGSMDAEVGINWQVIDAATDEYVKENSICCSK
jgi:hypothetical protein